MKKYRDARVHEKPEGTYIIRDVWADSGKLERCEYAVLHDGYLKWTPCHEGVMFADIEPAFKRVTNG